MTKITKIIFDNDGVNIDSEHLAMQVMDDFGYDMVAKYIAEPIEGLARGDIYIKYKGVSSNDIIEDLINKFDLPIEALKADYGIDPNSDNKTTIEELSDQLTKATITAFEGGLFTLSGFVETSKIIQKQFGAGNIALCTTSRADRMHATEHAKDPTTGENAGWKEVFPDVDDLRISGYGHKNKYEHFRTLHPDWKPEETVVVEDTDGSTKKAIAAGFTNVIGIVASKFQCDTPENKNAEIQKLIKAGARCVVTDYADLPDAAKWIENDCEPNNIPEFHSRVHILRASGSGGESALQHKLG